MPNRVVFSVFVVLVHLAGAPVLALAQPASGRMAERMIEGEVVHTASRWSADGTQIVTESTLATADGQTVVVSALGGHADGYRMVALHGPRMLEVGETVAVRVHATGTGYQLQEVMAVRGGPSEFVRTTATKSGSPLYWASGCVHIAFDEDGSSDIPGDEELAIMAEVLDTWRNATASCSYLTFRLDDATDDQPGFDGKNVIKFREDRWCRPATEDTEERCYSRNAAALTVLTFVDDAMNPRDGEIVDADIEMNAVDFSVSAGGQSAGTAACNADLAATLTHEIGHLLGLDHTCWDGTDTRPVDDQGEPVPLCSSPGLPASITDATMYNFQDCGETKKASPEADDVAGVCAIYPLADDPGECRRADVGGNGSCCSVAGGAGGAPLGPLVALALLVGLVLRRGARRPASRGARGNARS